MISSIIPRELVAEYFTVAPAVLARYEARGLIRVVREGAIEGYPPAEVRRIWTIVSLQRDLGINLAGVEAILKLRRHLDDVHQRLSRLAVELQSAVAPAAEEGEDE